MGGSLKFLPSREDVIARLTEIPHVDVTDVAQEKVVSKDEVIFEAARDPSELVEMSKRAQDLASGGQLDASSPTQSADAEGLRKQEILARAKTKVLPFLDADEAERLTGLCNALEGATAETRGEALANLEQFLRAYSYLF